MQLHTPSVAVCQEDYALGFEGALNSSHHLRLCSSLLPQLWIDATYVKVREGDRIVSMATIVAVGVNTDGRREVLGVATGASEAEPFWKAFLRALADRGLRGVKLVIADDHTIEIIGLLAKRRQSPSARFFS